MLAFGDAGSDASRALFSRRDRRTELEFHQKKFGVIACALTTANSAAAERTNARWDETINRRDLAFPEQNKDRHYGVFAIS